MLRASKELSEKSRKKAQRILEALRDVGLGYLQLGQPSPTLSGGEAQRVKLAKYLGSRSLSDRLLLLDEPSTGLHPQDISGLLTVLDRIVRAGGTVIVVEHNTDIIRAADWVIDLGPGAGPEGGHILFAGRPENISEEESLTGKALQTEDAISPRPESDVPVQYSKDITIQGARSHNLKDVTVTIPKSALTVVTGVSGSGKSSLVTDVLGAEAERRFLESLSMYERQSTTEGPEAPVDAVSGLGVAVSVGAGRRRYSRRATIGRETEIIHHLTVLLAYAGERTCEQCGTLMVRRETWVCPECNFTARIAAPREFLPSNWLSACPACQGIGTVSVPNPDKLIIHPDQPLCKGAMYSPGFFPFGYMCKPPNMYYSLQALGKKYDFDPAKTPWNQMTPEAQHAFLFGDPEPLEIHYKNNKGQVKIFHRPFRGFYQLIGDWDQFGTYVDIKTCPECNGATLRPEFLAVTLHRYTIHQLGELPLTTLEKLLKVPLGVKEKEFNILEQSYNTVLKRLHFLIQVGLGYIHLNRITASLSAGEAERVTLAGVLGSDLTSMTILLDEPSRGLHPSEVGALVEALYSLRDEGNTVVVVEHDPVLIKAADHIIDVGPGAGTAGGCIVAEGSPDHIAQADTVTGMWLRGERKTTPFQSHGQTKLITARRDPRTWMTITGARAHNLKRKPVTVPLGVLVGICGVSGSGKSTLFIDTVGRALVPKKHTTSVAYEPITPGEYESIENAPERVILVDQVKRGIYSPAKFLNVETHLQDLYGESEDAKALGITKKQLKSRCSVCNGTGIIKMDMGFLPAVHSPCDACGGTGYSAEAWDVRIKGYTLPELLTLTIDEVYELFNDVDNIARPLKTAKDVGLGYLVLRQPAYTLSGGEAQRLKIVKELCKRTTKQSLYILDEPTVGQHVQDVEQLIHVLQRLVDNGHSVVVIEHHPHVLAACDWLIELGPVGGPDGGYIIAAGTPEKIAQKNTPTAFYIHEILEGVQ